MSQSSASSAGTRWWWPPARGRCVFDALILACPLDAALELLDASDEERALFGAVTWNDYHVIAVELERPPPARYGFFADHFPRGHEGEPVFFYRRWMEGRLVLYYTCPPRGATLGDSEAAVRRLAARGGGQVRELVLRHAWRYFPHVGPGRHAAGLLRAPRGAAGAAPHLLGGGALVVLRRRDGGRLLAGAGGAPLHSARRMMQAR